MPITHATTTGIIGATQWNEAHDLSLFTPSEIGAVSGTGVAGRVAEFSDSDTIQAANLIAPSANILTLTNNAASTLALNITAAKTLTLTAADNYTLTIPATGTAALGAGTLTVSTVSDATLSAHTHAITASENPGAASSLLQTDATGFMRLNLFRVGSVGTGSPSTTHPLIVLQSQNAAAGFSVRNGFTGTAARAEFVVLNDSNLGAKFYAFSSTYTASGLFSAGRVVFDAGDTGGLVMGASNASGFVAIYSGGLATNRIGLLMDINQNVGIGRLIGETINAKLEVVKKTATTNAVIETARLLAEVSTAATGSAAGFGVGQSFYAETATDGTNQQQGLISTSWVEATNATRKAKLSLSAYDTAARLGLEIEASGSAVKLGFFGGTTAIQQVLNAYTSDDESGAYTGIDNAQAGTVYATVADLNALRTAYETLRASYDDLRTKLQTSTIVA